MPMEAIRGAAPNARTPPREGMKRRPCSFRGSGIIPSKTAGLGPPSC